MKIIFFGTPQFAVPFLEALTKEKDFEVVSVVTQPDKPSGRGEKITSPEVKVFAEQNNIPVLQFQSLKKTKAIETLSTLDADLFVVVAYGKMIPGAILDIPSKGAINVHPSLLPKYRGPSPIQWAILNGDQKTGISIMLLDEGMDTGPILAQKTIELSKNENSISLESKIHSVGPTFLCEVLKLYESGSCIPSAQNDQNASVTRLISKEDGKIDWNIDAKKIERMVHAFVPWPTAWTTIKIKDDVVRIKILEAKVEKINLNKPNGTLCEDQGKLFVSVNSEALELITLQPEGRVPMQAQAFLAGRKDWIGKIFE